MKMQDLMTVVGVRVLPAGGVRRHDGTLPTSWGGFDSRHLHVFGSVTVAGRALNPVVWVRIPPEEQRAERTVPSSDWRGGPRAPVSSPATYWRWAKQRRGGDPLEGALLEAGTGFIHRR